MLFSSKDLAQPPDHMCRAMLRLRQERNRSIDIMITRHLRKGTLAVPLALYNSNRLNSCLAVSVRENLLLNIMYWTENETTSDHCGYT